MANPKKVITGNVRGSFVNVFKSRMNDLSGKEEFSMMILIDKKDDHTVNKIKAALQAAVSEKWGDKKPAGLRIPLRDGDAEKDGEEPYAGNYFMNVKANKRPGIVDSNLDPVMDESEFRSGDYCRVSLNAFAYDQKGNKGVSFGLNNVQVVSKGEPLGGSSRAEDDFEAINDAGMADDDFLAA